MRLQLPRSKTDQEGQGAEEGTPRGEKPGTCPVRAMEAWLSASGYQYGPVFWKVTTWGTVEPHTLHPLAGLGH